MSNRVYLNGPKYKVGERVKLTDRARPSYEQYGKPYMPPNTTGTIHSIRERYVGTPNEYFQYYILADDAAIASHFRPNSTDYLLLVYFYLHNIYICHILYIVSTIYHS